LKPRQKFFKGSSRPGGIQLRQGVAGRAGQAPVPAQNKDRIVSSQAGNMATKATNMGHGKGRPVETNPAGMLRPTPESSLVQKAFFVPRPEGASGRAPWTPVRAGTPRDPKGRTRLRRFHALRHPVLNCGWPDVHVRPNKITMRDGIAGAGHCACPNPGRIIPPFVEPA
jgi:hypothetical protein